MPKYPGTASTAKNGINYVRTIVDYAKCIYHPIAQENDLGIDAFIEIIKDGEPLNIQFAVQIKSGESYYSPKTGDCSIPVGNHYDYWVNHPLDVIGIVYVPSEDAAYWIDIKKYLRSNPDSGQIKFKRKLFNTLDKSSFSKFLCPAIQGQLPVLTFVEASKYFQSNDLTLSYIGLVSLFKNHANNPIVWDLFFNYLHTNDSHSIHPILVYYMAHVPWHSDMIALASLTDEIKEYARLKFSLLNMSDVIKLLELIDEENGISRGTIGQSVEAIISSIPNRDSMLMDIIKNGALDMRIREDAAVIFSLNNREKASDIFSYLFKQGSSYSSYMFSYLNDGHGLDPYG